MLPRPSVSHYSRVAAVCNAIFLSIWSEQWSRLLPPRLLPLTRTRARVPASRSVGLRLLTFPTGSAFIISGRSAPTECPQAHGRAMGSSLLYHAVLAAVQFYDTSPLVEIDHGR
jgi:hypothetical protein